MRTALISDIHGNMDALQTVLADIDTKNVDRIVCLGDIVGYGPNPLEALDLIRQRCEYAIIGNHDFAVLYEPTNFNVAAEQASFWTRSQFEVHGDPALRKERLDYLGKLDIRRWEDDVLYVHASPRKPINEYIFPDDVLQSPNKIRGIFERVKSICFVGHTHCQGVFTSEPEFYLPVEIGWKFRFEKGKKAIVNPGSVGQPRDRDPRAAYAIYDAKENLVEFMRLEYDIDAVAKKIQNIPNLHNFLATRLYDGR